MNVKTSEQKVYKRALSRREADRCETACEPECKCRCGGAKHGAARGTGLTFFNSLPEDDPHYIPSKEAKAAAKKRAADEKWKRRMAAITGARYGE
jgi:hypothetical protein